jgi:hypothetical protein
MKTNIAKVILTVSFLIYGFGLMAQAPPHPPGHGSSTNEAPGPGPGAPIGSGMVILIGLSAVYGAKKVYSTRQEEQE